MKKILCAAMAGVLALGLMTGCGGKTSNVTDEKTLYLGGTGPLTGDYATYGVSARNGAQIAVDEVNENGGAAGYKLHLRYEDDQADPQLAVQGYATLMDDGMDVCLGGVTSASCVAVTEAAKEDGILTLTPSASQKGAAQYKNNFRVCFLDPDLGKYSADFIKENALGEKIATLYDKSNDYSVGVHEAFLRQAKDLGMDIVTTQAFTNQSNTDFSVQLQAVKSSGADLLFMPIYAQESAYVLTQAASYGLNVLFFGVDGMDGVLEKIGNENKDLTNGVMLLTPFAADSKDEKVANFVSKYKAAYNAVPDQFAADAYDAVYAIKAAFEKAGAEPKTDGFNEAMIKAMTEINLDGVTGSMSWNEDGEVTKKAMAVTIENGVYVPYETQSAE
jgi:branched-chain amino acid transport system substrate-binding protein